jgi:HAD superfamily hydrolase (TIGR01509 family)
MDDGQLRYVHAHTIHQSLEHLFADEDERREAAAYRSTIDYGRFLQYLTIEPTLVEALDWMRGRFKTAIATNRTDTMDRLLLEFGLVDRFELVVTSLDVKRPKPAPDSLLKILSHFGAEPHQAVFVGDSEVDEETARAAGVWFVAYRNPALSADRHIQRLAELTAVLSAADPNEYRTGESPTMEVDERGNGDPSADDAAGEWADRRLCSDGNCIGVIGSDGRCKECGKPDAGGGGEPVAAPQSPLPSAVDDQPEAADEPTEDRGAEWAGRRLCSDGNCIGVIGPDGRCKECGKPFSG